MMRDEVAVIIQLRNAKVTDIWYFLHSSPKLQLPLPTSWKYNTVMPAEAEAAASDSVAVT